MSRYRKVDPRIWNDEKFRELSDSGKLTFFFLLTHPHMTALGAMRSTIAGLAEEMGWEAEAFREAFGELLSKDMAEHEAKACLISLPNFLKYNPPESPNVVKAWISALDLLPECELKTRVIAGAVAFAEGMSEAFAKALPEGFAKTMPNQKQKQKQKQEKKEALAAPSTTAVVKEIFEYWKTTMGHQKAVFDDKRKRLIEARLKNYSADDLKAAIKGCSLTPYNMGMNPNSTRYDSLELILRDAEHIERFMRTKPTSHPVTGTLPLETVPVNWIETNSGIEAKARELGIDQGGDQYPVFKRRVIEAAKAQENPQ